MYEELKKQYDLKFPVIHNTCEDFYYSCPLSPGGSGSGGTECDCFAQEEHDERWQFIEHSLLQERKRVVGILEDHKQLNHLTKEDRPNEYNKALDDVLNQINK